MTAHTVMRLGDPAELARAAAEAISTCLSGRVAQHQRASMALSGGSSPVETHQLLGATPAVWWSQVTVTQVDERFAPRGHEEANSAMIERTLIDPLAELGVPVAEWRPLPVPAEGTAEDATAAAATRQAIAEAAELLGRPPVWDLAVLGLGSDGHTASLVPGDPVLEAEGDLAHTDPYQGRRRMTMTYASIERTHQLIWIVTGESKRDALRQLLAQDPEIPAGRIRHDRSLILTDLES